MDVLFEEMAVLEPDTAGELATKYDISKSRTRRLERLWTAGEIPTKDPTPDRAPWMTEPGHAVFGV